MTAAPSEVLRSREWLLCSQPFPHLVARNVFTPDFYDALETQMLGIIARGLSETPSLGRFSRNLPGYDSYALGLGRPEGEPTDLFLSPAWRNLMAGVWGITPTPYLFVGAHHHAPRSGNGFIHSDFNPAWFPKASPDTIQTPQPDLCAYKTGEGPLPAEAKIEVVRGAVLILYVANAPWFPGDGGDTGLYASADATVGRPAVTCPPENNTLVSFECTPHSFHAFLSNTRTPRTSIIMWVHRPLEEAVALYGEQHLERWQS